MHFAVTKKRLLLTLLSFGAIMFCLWFGWLYYEHSKANQKISSPTPPNKERETSQANKERERSLASNSKSMKKPQAGGEVTSMNHRKLELLWENLKWEATKEAKESIQTESIEVEAPADGESDKESSSPQESNDEEWSTIDEWIDDVYEGMEIGTYLGEVEIGGQKYPARLGVPIEVTWYGPGTDNPRKRTEEEQRRYNELGRELDNVDPFSPRGQEIIAEMERINAETIRPVRHESRALYRKPTREELRDMYIKSTPEERRDSYRMWAKREILQNR